MLWYYVDSCYFCVNDIFYDLCSCNNDCDILENYCVNTAYVGPDSIVCGIYLEGLEKICAGSLFATPVILRFVEDIFLLPRVITDDRCPICEALFWYRGLPKYEELEKCDCYIQSCDNCGNILCSCTIESRFEECPWCLLHDRWVIIPPELFSG